MAVASAGSPALRTACNLVLLGLILQAIQVGVFLAVGFLPFGSAAPRLGWVALGAIGAVWVLLVTRFSFATLRGGEYQAARRPTFVFALLSILTIGVFSGLCYILAYHEIGQIPKESLPAPSSATPLPRATGEKVCPICGTASPPGAKHCGRCGFVVH